MQSVCVFLGANPGIRPEYTEAAHELGATLARRDITLVYGGSAVGLMQELADAALAAGGRVEGVIPQALVDKEIAKSGLNDLHVVDSMHERKAKMAELAEGFIALPGGLGTLEEFFEVLTWAQLGFHAKPCGLMNVLGYYNPLMRFLDRVEGEGFLKLEHKDMVLVDDTPAGLLARMERYQAPDVRKWISAKREL